MLNSDLVISELHASRTRSVSVSTFGDAQWDLSHLISDVASDRCSYLLKWSRLPEAWVVSCKHFLYAYMRYGRVGFGKPSPRTVVGMFAALVLYVKFLDKTLSLRTISEITGNHARAYAVSVFSLGLSSHTTHARLYVAELMWAMRESSIFAPKEAPWGEQSTYIYCGAPSRTKSRTATLPLDKAVALFQCLEKELEGAEEAVQIYLKTEETRLTPSNSSAESRRKSVKRWLESQGSPSARSLRKRIDRVRAACLGEIAILTGMRLNEIASTPYDAYYEAHMGELTIGRVKGRASKTREGIAEWVAPTHLGRIYAILRDISSVGRREIAAELAKLELDFTSGALSVKGSQRRIALHKIKDCAFLARNYATRDFDVTKASRLRKLLAELAVSGRVGWIPKPHQLRRTFAVLIAHHADGDLRYLKEQFKHWSLDMTLMYAQEDGHDSKLASEVFAEIRWRHREVVKDWMQSTSPLTGGAGGTITRNRERYGGMTTKSLDAVIGSMTDNLMLRATGHSWCLSGASPTCGGKGLYDSIACASCPNAVIDSIHLGIWRKLREQQLNVLKLCDSGPGGLAAAERGLDCCNAVLKDLTGSELHDN